MSHIPAPRTSALGPSDLDATYHELIAAFDREHGGFGAAPKFPRPAVLNFLLHQYSRTRSPLALQMVVDTLSAMGRGAIHDQLDGGFHRYTVDAAWRVPHFEKMLYDQAQLAATYTDAFQASHNDALGDLARSTLDYTLTRLRAAHGGFSSAEDADSPAQAGDQHLREGAFYLWTIDELRRVLGSDAEPLAYMFGVNASGNLGAGLGADLSGQNALSLRIRSPTRLADFR